MNKLLTETETRVGENFERITSLEATVKTLESQNNHLLDRVEDLENRLCRSNLPFVNIPDGSETGKEPKQFIVDFLMVANETRTETLKSDFESLPRHFKFSCS